MHNILNDFIYIQNDYETHLATETANSAIANKFQKVQILILLVII